jgi:hypothetical protein
MKDPKILAMALSIKKAPSLWGSGLEGGLSMKGKKSARGFGPIWLKN